MAGSRQDDKMRELLGRVAALESGDARPQVRTASAVNQRVVHGEATEFIRAGQSGTVELASGAEVQGLNLTGHPIWSESDCSVALIGSTALILESDAANIIFGKYVSGDLASPNSYDFTTPAEGGTYNKVRFNPAEATFVNLGQVHNHIGANISATKYVAFSTGEDFLEILSSEAGVAGGGDFPGFPLTDPTTGASLGIVLFAQVNEATDVASTDGTFDFDGAVALFGTSPAGDTGTCSNCEHAFTNNENLIVVGNGVTWRAVKLATNWIRAKVNVSGGVLATDATFTFDNITAIVGTATAIGGPVAVNTPAFAWEDNEDFEAYQRNDGDWQPLKLVRYNVVKGLTTGAVVRTDPTFQINTITVIHGDKPAPTTLTVKNEPPIKCGSGESVEARYNVTAHATDLDKRWDTGTGGNITHHLRGYPQFDGAIKQLFTQDVNTIEWNTIVEVLKWLQGYVHGSDQSVGHDVSADPEWQDDTSECPE